jgi:Xaa-Pro aminopeptidase
MSAVKSTRKPPFFASPGCDRERLAQAVRAADLDGILLTSPENVYYTTGYPAIHSAGNPILHALRNVLPFFTWVDSRGRRTLICWGGAAAGVKFDAERTLTFADAPGGLAVLQNLLRASAGKVGSLGIESDCPFAVARLVQAALPQATLQVADSVIGGLRLVKSAHEIACLRRSTQIVEATVAELSDLLYLGISRPSLIQQAKQRMLKNGATGIGHVTINFGASNPEVEIDEHLEANRLVVLDLGALYHGYASDNRRLLFSGSAPPDMNKLHLQMCDILDGTAAYIQPGRTFDEIYRRAMQLYDRYHLQAFIPNVGHTIGLNTEEAWIYKDSPIVVQPGFVLNLEMYSLYSTGELIGDEETYLVTESGVEQLTSLPRPIRSIPSG